MKKIFKKLFILLLTFSITFSSTFMTNIVFAEEEETDNNTPITEIIEEDKIETAENEEIQDDSIVLEDELNQAVANEETAAAADLKTINLVMPENSYINGANVRATLKLYYGRYSYDYSAYSVELIPFDNRGTESSEPVIQSFDINYSREEILKASIEMTDANEVSTNIQLGTPMYYAGENTSFNSADAISASFDDFNFVLRKAKLTVNISLPEDYVSSDDEMNRVYIYAKYTNGSNVSFTKNYATIGNNNPVVSFQTKNVADDAEELKNLYVSVNDTYNNNLYSGRENQYFDGEKLVFGSETASAVSLNENVVNINLNTTKLGARISIPDDYEGEEITFNGTLYAKIGSSSYSKGFSIKSSDEPQTVYFNSLPINEESVDMVYVYLNSNSYSHSLVTGNNEYYRDGEKLVGSSTDATAVDISSAKVLDMVLRNAKIKFKYVAPENYIAVSDADLKCTANFGYLKNGISYSKSMTFKVVGNDNEVYFNSFPFEIDQLTYVSGYVTVNGDCSNLVTDTEGYLGNNGLVSSKSMAKTIDLSEDEVTTLVFMPWITELKVKIIKPANLLLENTDKYSGTIYASYDVNGTTIVKSVTFTHSLEDEQMTYYINRLPGDLTKLKYLSISIHNQSTLTNFVTGSDEYYTSSGLISTKSDAEQVSLTPGETKEIVITPALTKAHFKLNLSDKALISAKDLKGNFSVVTNNTTYSKNIIFEKDKRSLEFYINNFPCDASSITSSYVNWQSEYGLITNIITGFRLYCNGDFFDTEKVNTPLVLNNLPVNLTVKESNVIQKFEVSLPENSAVRGEPLTGYLQVYYDSYYSVCAYFEIKAGETSTIAYAVLPDDYTEIKQLYYVVNGNNATSTDVVTGVRYYYDGANWTTDSNKCNMPVSSDAFKLKLQKNRTVSGIISMPENAYSNCSKLTANFELSMRYKNSSGNTYTNRYVYNFTMENGVREVPYSFAIEDSAYEISGVSLKVYKADNKLTNIYTGGYIYLSEDGWNTSSSSSISVDGTAQDVKFDITLPVVKSVDGRFIVPENAFINSGEATINFYALTDKTYYSSSLKITKDNLGDFEYHIPLGLYDSQVKRIYFTYSNVSDFASNIYTRGTVYFDETGNAVPSQIDINKEFDDGHYRQELTLPINKTVSGSIELPEDAKIYGSNFNYYIKVTTDYSNYSSMILNIENTETKKYDYFINLGLFDETIKKIEVYSNSTQSSSNMDVRSKYYTNDLEMIDSLAELSLPIVSANLDLNIKIKTVPVIKAHLLIPENAYLTSGNITAYVKANVSNYLDSYTNDYSQSLTVDNLDLKDLEIEIPLAYYSSKINSIRVYFSSNSNTSNLSSSNCYYVNEEEMTWDNHKLDDLTVDSKIVNVTLKPKLLKTITGSLSLPDNIDITAKSISGTISFYNQQLSYSMVNFNFSNDTKKTDFRITMPVGTTELKYIKVNVNSSDVNEVKNQIIYVGADDGWSESYDNIHPFELTSDFANITLNYPKPKRISGTVTIDEQAYFFGSSVDVDILASVNGKKYEADTITLAESTNSASYEINLPAVSNAVDYLEVKVSAANQEAIDSNLLFGTYYFGSANGAKENSAMCDPIPYVFNNAEKDIELDIKRTIYGDIIVPAGSNWSNNIEGTASVYVNSINYTSSFVITSENLNGDSEVSYKVAEYSFDLPAGSKTIDKLSVSLSINNNRNTNLFLTSYVYNAENDKFENSEVNHSFVMENSSKKADLLVSRTFSISGNISLSENGYFRNENLNGYIRAYVHNNPYVQYFTINEFTNSADYEIRLPSELNMIDKVTMLIYSNSILETNILTGREVVLTENGWVLSDSADAKQFTIEDGTFDLTLNLNLPEIYTINTTLVRNSNETSKLDGILNAYVDNEVFSSAFSFEESETSTTCRIEIPFSKELESYSLSYELENAGNYLYPTDEVYLTEDGYTFNKNSAKEISFADRSLINTITIAEWDLFADAKLLNSPHPYNNDGVYSMSYVFPGYADALNITFNDLTYAEKGFDDINIYDVEGNLYNTYSGNELSSKTISVPSNGFEIVISADMNNASYGFGIDDIVPVNGVLENDYAAGIVYENGVMTSAVIYNQTDEKLTMFISAAEYDTFGKMISISTDKAEVNPGMNAVSLDYTPHDEAASGKMMLYRDNLTPLQEAIFKINKTYCIFYHYQDEVNTVRVEYVKDGNKAIKPSIMPNKFGYKFTGWYVDEELTRLFDFEEQLENNKNLYAGWSKAYAVKTETEGEGAIEFTGDSLSSISSGSTVVLSAKASDGYKFAKWDVSGVSDFNINVSGQISFEMPENDVDIKAVFARLVDIVWTNSNIVYMDQVMVPVDGRIYIPEEYKTITLSGILNENGYEVSSKQYDYIYKKATEDGLFEYSVTERKDLIADEEGIFTIENLPLETGVNTLNVYTTVNGVESVITVKFIKNQTKEIIADSVTQFDLYDMADIVTIEDLVTGIETYWNIENNRMVMIVQKDSEFAKRMMLKPNEEGHIGVGDIWMIPSCNQFPLGMTFKIVDIGSPELAPEPLEYVLEKTYSADDYLYIITEDPSFNDIFSESFSMDLNGFTGIAFTMHPTNSVLECTMSDDEGNSVMATSGSFYDQGISKKGWQGDEIKKNIMFECNSKNWNRIDIGLKFKETVVYDRDGSENTKWDQIALSGNLNIKDLGISAPFDWNIAPSHTFNLLGWKIDYPDLCDLLPNELGMVVDYTNNINFKISIGGTLGGDPKAEKNEPSGQWSLSEVAKSFKKITMGAGDNDIDNKISSEYLGFTVSGVDMDNEIILGCVGLSLATFSPIVGSTYQGISNISYTQGIVPVAMIMFVWNLDGSVSCKISYQYTKENYVANGLDVIKEGFKSSDSVIKSLTPTSTKDIGFKHRANIYDISRAGVSDYRDPIGKHTINFTGEAKFETDFGIQAALLVFGLNIAEARAGFYLDSKADVVGDAVFEEKQLPDYHIDGSLQVSFGAIAAYKTKFNIKGNHVDVGWDYSDDFKYELYSDGISSISYGGTVTTPSTEPSIADKPLEGIKVEMKKKHSLDPVKTTETDKNGKFSFKNIDPSSEYTLTFTDDEETYKKVVSEEKIASKSIYKNFSMSKDEYHGLKGKVINVEDKTPLKDCIVSLVNASDKSKVSVYTNDHGEFEFKVVKKDFTAHGEVTKEPSGLMPGVYKMTILCSGFKPLNSQIVIESSRPYSVVNVGEYELIKLGYYIDDKVPVTGKILDIATGRPTGVALKLNVREGIDNTDSYVKLVDSTTVNEKGEYELKLPVGSYTIEVVDTRVFVTQNKKYATTHFNVVIPNDENGVTVDSYVGTSNNDEQIRIVLSWGSSPRDLDSHLIGPNESGNGRFHIYYISKNYKVDGESYADLDLDCTSGYGPETTTIYRKSLSGLYSFYVQDFTNRNSSNSKEMGLSGAKVEVYKGHKLLDTYRVPNKNGTVWHVFDYNPINDELIPSNNFFNCSDSSNVGTYVTSSDAGISSVEESDVKYILSVVSKAEKN